MMVVDPHPRTSNVYIKDGKPLVAKVGHISGDTLRTSIETAIGLLGGLDKVVSAGDQVMLKPNFNTGSAMPLSTEKGFLAAVIEILQDAGAQVTVGEACGRAAAPTDGVVDKLGMLPLLRRYGVPFVNFEHDERVTVQIPGKYWDSLRVPRSIFEAEKRIYLPNFRSHSSARFTAALKLSVGWADSATRDYLHEDPTTTESMIPDLNLAWQPDLVVMDGRRTTINWYGRGEYFFPNVIMASGDMVAIDTEAVKILKGFPGRNRLDIPLEEMGQFVVAQEHNLGSMDYLLVQSPARLETEDKPITDPAALHYAKQFEEGQIS
jgi:uncharacterized protein (DUF362 family)